MLSLFSILSLETRFDLAPPFELKSDKKIGEFWEFGGSAVPFQNYLQIVPPIQYKKGCVWTNLQIPKRDWSITYDLKFTEGDEGTSFGLWLTDKYSDEGTLAGGPNVFKGIVVICTLRVDRKGRSFVDFFFLQNKGIRKYTLSSLKDPIATIPYKIGSLLSIELGLDAKNIEIKCNSELLLKDSLKVDLTENYIGLTGSNGQAGSKLDLHSIKFHVLTEKEVNAKRSVFMNAGMSDSYSPDSIFHYRNLQFKEMYVEHAKLEEHLDNSTATYDRVIELIDEANKVAYQISSFSELNTFIRETIIPYTDKWYKRTVKVSDIIHGSKDAVTAAMNYTNSVLKSLNESITENSQKFSAKSSTLAELFNEVEDDFDINELIQESGSKFSSTLLIIGVAEFISLVCILYFFSTKRGKACINW